MRKLVLVGLNIAVLLFVAFRALADREPAHPDALFWHADFQAEYTASNKGWTLSDDLTYWIVRDYAGRYINFENGYRRTVGQPTVYEHTIWLIGNSTMVSAQVIDSDTIASYLQALVPTRRVVNVGMGGAYLIHEYRRLLTLPIMPGDTVVFYDGQLDAENALTMADVERYRHVLADAHRFAMLHGAVFYHVLQPHLCTVQISDWDHYLSAHFNNICDNYARWWSSYQATEDGTDFTHVLDNARRNGTVFFFDVHHSSERGNEIVSRLLYELLFQTI